VVRKVMVISANSDEGGKENPWCVSCFDSRACVEVFTAFHRIFPLTSCSGNSNCYFGESCIRAVLAQKAECPKDRRPVDVATGLGSLTMVARKVWALRVKCHLAPDECPATGELGKDEVQCHTIVFFISDAS
jgi:hypothetical protein